MTANLPFEISIQADDQRSVALGVELYCKHLDSMAAQAEKMGREEKGEYETEAEVLRARLVRPVLDGKEPLAVNVTDLPVCKRGLKYLVANLKAAKGTLKPLGFDHTVRELEDAAGWIEANVLPEFDEQRSLEIPATQQGPVNGQGAAE